MSSRNLLRFGTGIPVDGFFHLFREIGIFQMKSMCLPQSGRYLSYVSLNSNWSESVDTDCSISLCGQPDLHSVELLPRPLMSTHISPPLSTYSVLCLIMGVDRYA